MGGKVLQLESERLFELGEARGKIIVTGDKCQIFTEERI